MTADVVELPLADTRPRGAAHLALGVLLLVGAVLSAVEDSFGQPSLVVLGIGYVAHGWPLLRRPRGRVRVDAAAIEVDHPLLRAPLRVELESVHSVVRGPVPTTRRPAAPIRRIDPARDVGTLPKVTAWVLDLVPRWRSPDLLVVLARPVAGPGKRFPSSLHWRSDGRTVRGVALDLALDDPACYRALGAVLGHRLVDRMTDDAWAFLVQEDVRYRPDPVEWMRTRVR